MNNLLTKLLRLFKRGDTLPRSLGQGSPEFPTKWKEIGESGKLHGCYVRCHEYDVCIYSQILWVLEEL